MLFSIMYENFSAANFVEVSMASDMKRQESAGWCRYYGHTLGTLRMASPHYTRKRADSS